MTDGYIVLKHVESQPTDDPYLAATWRVVANPTGFEGRWYGGTVGEVRRELHKFGADGIYAIFKAGDTEVVRIDP